MDKRAVWGKRLPVLAQFMLLLTGVFLIKPTLSAAHSWDEDDRLVLAFYYPWYRTMESSGYCTWNFGGFKYEDRDEQCEENRNSPHLPAGGLYDSLDPDVIRRHLDESRRAGIDGWIVSWWGIEDHTDVLDLILDVASSHAPGFAVTIYYERIPGCRGYVCTEASRKERIEGAIEDFQYLDSHYFCHPSYLKVSGRPVVFVYMRAMLQGMGVWPEIIERLQSEMDLFLSADAIITFAGSLVPGGFDQIHFYNQVYELLIFSPGLDYRGFVKSARLAKRGAAITVLPGYDERLVPGRPGIHLERKDGRTYRRVWDKAIAADPDWILVTSFNEWYETSEIEPSRELGDFYLEMTAEYSARFKGKK